MAIVSLIEFPQKHSSLDIKQAKVTWEKTLILPMIYSEQSLKCVSHPPLSPSHFLFMCTSLKLCSPSLRNTNVGVTTTHFLRPCYQSKVGIMHLQTNFESSQK